MKTVIKHITLQNFKGCKEATYTFDGKNVTLSGANGSGKTTINTAYDWVMADKDTELHSNPPVRPVDIEECTPRVDVVLDIDGREVSVAKLQKQTKKGNSVSLSNTYEVNAVEYGERDFKAKMAEYGIDFDLFLPLSHPDYFTSQKSADMRKVLFAMESEKSDKEIADLTDGADDVAKLLDNYTVEEVKAMQNATLRKIKEVYGKDGEILRAKIEGMEQSKVDIDVAELELQRNALKVKITENKAKQEDVSKQYEEYQKLSGGIMELKFAEGDLQRKANEENIKARRDIENKISDNKFLVKQTEKTIADTKFIISTTEESIISNEAYISNLRNQYKIAQDRKFDENSLVCSYCGQEYPQDRKEQIKADFESKKATEIKKITELGNKAKAELDKEKETLARLEKELPEHEKSLEMLNTSIAELEKQLSELPESVDISDTEEYKAIQKQIAEKEQAMSQMNSFDDIRQKLKSEAEDLQSQLTEVEKQITLSQRNVEIDEQIADLRNKQSEYEQNKADCEKILYQLDLVSKRKNELLTDDINRHFDIVRWQMFEYQKNGEIKDCCIPLIDGKRFDESTNKGREILAKLDIIKGLQKFYGQYYPVFLDNAESLSEETLKRIDMHCQLILLKVTEDEKLKVEVG